MKHTLAYGQAFCHMSPPARGRGLKRSLGEEVDIPDSSPPARGRGLKLVCWVDIIP